MIKTEEIVKKYLSFFCLIAKIISVKQMSKFDLSVLMRKKIN